MAKKEPSEFKITRVKSPLNDGKEWYKMGFKGIFGKVCVVWEAASTGKDERWLDVFGNLLDRKMVAKMLPALQRFARTGSLKRPSNRPKHPRSMEELAKKYNPEFRLDYSKKCEHGNVVGHICTRCSCEK